MTHLSPANGEHPKSSVPCSVGILTFNSAAVLERALKSVSAMDDVIVCDGGSTDATRLIAEQFGATVIDQAPDVIDAQGRLVDISGARRQLVNCARNGWILMLDSDEEATPALVDEIAQLVSSKRDLIGAYNVPRLYVLENRIIDCAMTYPSFQRRLVHKDALDRYEGIVHDRPVLRDGFVSGQLEGHQLVPLPPFREVWKKWIAYLRMEEIQKANLSFRRWGGSVARRELRACWFYLKRLARSYLRCRGNRLPLRYELGRLAYEFLMIVYTGRRFIGLGSRNIERAWDSTN